MKDTYIISPSIGNLYVMTKPCGAACNLDCTYCYYLEKAQSPLFHNTLMDEDTLERFVKQYIECQTSEYILFTWHGGEPLLRGINFYKKALKLQQKYAKNKHIDNCLQTNGTLLSDEWCRFFKENNFLIGLSLDGPEHCHNRYRFYKDGKGSFAKVMAGLELLHRYGVEFNILATVNDYNVQFPTEVYRFFKSVQAQFIQFSPVVERIYEKDGSTHLQTNTGTETATLTPWSVPVLEYGKFLCTIFDEWVRYDVGNYFVTTFDNTLANLVGTPPNNCIFATSCGHALAMEANGDVYACDHFVFSKFLRGNIKTKSLASITLSDEQFLFGNEKINGLPKTCRTCPFLRLCNGECPKNRFLRTKEGESGLNYLCEGLKHYFSHTYPYMDFMAKQLLKEQPPQNVMEWIKNGMK